MSVPARAYLSIGEVLNKLRGDFADITISKIRFLESEGLIDPQRTPSGYRKFTSTDYNTWADKEFNDIVGAID